LNILWVDDKPTGEHFALIAIWSKQFPNILFKVSRNECECASGALSE